MRLVSREQILLYLLQITSGKGWAGSAYSSSKFMASSNFPMTASSLSCSLPSTAVNRANSSPPASSIAVSSSEDSSEDSSDDSSEEKFARVSPPTSTKSSSEVPMLETSDPMVASICLIVSSSSSTALL